MRSQWCVYYSPAGPCCSAVPAVLPAFPKSRWSSSHTPTTCTPHRRCPLKSGAFRSRRHGQCIVAGTQSQLAPLGNRLGSTCTHHGLVPGPRHGCAQVLLKWKVRVLTRVLSHVLHCLCGHGSNHLLASGCATLTISLSIYGLISAKLGWRASHAFRAPAPMHAQRHSRNLAKTHGAVARVPLEHDSPWRAPTASREAVFTQASRDAAAVGLACQVEHSSGAPTHVLCMHA